MTPALLDAPAAARPVPVLRCYRFELVKLLSQWRIRLFVALCWLAPALFVAVVSQQSALPVDTVFGRWMHATGWAGSLVGATGAAVGATDARVDWVSCTVGATTVGVVGPPVVVGRGSVGAMRLHAASATTSGAKHNRKQTRQCVIVTLLTPRPSRPSTGASLVS